MVAFLLCVILFVICPPLIIPAAIIYAAYFVFKLLSAPFWLFRRKG